MVRWACQHGWAKQDQSVFLYTAPWRGSIQRLDGFGYLRTLLLVLLGSDLVL